MLNLDSKNISIRKIENKLDVAKSTVSDIWKLFQQTGDNKERNRPGRSKITYARTDQYIKRQSLSDKTRTAVDIQRDVNEWKGVRMSVWTFRRRLILGCMGD